jgi:hypothetical protein
LPALLKPWQTDKKWRDKTHMFGNVQFERKPKGAFIVDGKEVAHTLQCVHHGGHFVSIRGSGTKRGFCMNCHGPTCGHKKCDPCLPFMKQIDISEKRNIPLG